MKRKSGRKQGQQGFTLVELIIATCILAVLASIALAQMRDYSRRARISEVVLATSSCKNVISENYQVRDSSPNPGSWGCENSGTSTYAGPVQTSSDGVVRVRVQNLDANVNNRYIYLVPTRTDGAAMTTPADLGKSVRGWTCGSDWALIRNALPANCRADTTTYASGTFQ